MGLSEEEAFDNVKQAIYEHFEAMEEFSTKENDLYNMVKEMFKSPRKEGGK